MPLIPTHQRQVRLHGNRRDPKIILADFFVAALVLKFRAKPRVNPNDRGRVQ